MSEGEAERQGWGEGERERERERESVPRSSTLPVQNPRGAGTHEVANNDLSQNQEPNAQPTEPPRHPPTPS